jgi:hypothetical protein
VEALIFVSHGRTNIDEGVFLNAGRLVYEGQLPYRDFPFSQGPLLPYVYGLAIHICGPSVLVGRVVSFLLAGVGIGATLWIAHSLGGRLAAMIAMALTIVNLPALWVAMTVRTQSLGTPLVLLAALALAAPRRGVWGWAAAPSLLLWASGARVTLLLAFAAVSLWVALQLRKSRQLLMRVAAVVGAQAIVIFSPLWITPDAARFHLFTAQLTRSERGGVQHGSFIDQAIGKISILFEPQTDFFPIFPLALAITINLAWMWRRGWRPNLERPLGDHLSAQFVLVALAMLVFVPHLVFSHGFLTYFVTSSALLVPAIAIGVAHARPDGARSPPFVLSIVASLLAFSLVTVPAHWSSWVGSGQSSFPAFREVGRQLGDLAGPDCTILTMETALAFETGCHVLPGLEYSIFSYFPKLSKQEAKRRGVLNAELLKQRVLELQPELIALGRASTSRPEERAAISRIPEFGWVHVPRDLPDFERGPDSRGARHGRGGDLRTKRPAPGPWRVRSRQACRLENARGIPLAEAVDASRAVVPTRAARCRGDIGSVDPVASLQPEPGCARRGYGPPQHE